MKINVIIPCRNEVAHIQECVKAIFNSEFDNKIELIVHVVDGMSEDGTRQIINNLIVEFPTLKLIDNPKKLTPFAFNLGIYACIDADYVQIVGARHILSSNYLQTCINKLSSDRQVWCVGGKLINRHMNETGRLISIAMGSVFGMGFGNFRTLGESCYTDTVTSPMYPSWVFKNIGYFDEDLIRNQDDDFNFRVTKAGGKIWFESSISLIYYVRGDFSKLWRQFYQYGYWKVYVNRKHSINTTYRQLIPPLFVLNLMLVVLSVLFGTLFVAITTLPFGLYLLLVVLFSLSKTSKLAEALKLMCVFPTMHIGYGLGYWQGIKDFLILKKGPDEKNTTLSR